MNMCRNVLHDKDVTGITKDGECLLCQRARKRKWYEEHLKDPTWVRAKQDRDLEYWRRRAGWYEPGGMATDAEMEKLRGFRL